MPDFSEVVQAIDLTIPGPAAALSGTLYTPDDGVDLHSGLLLAGLPGEGSGAWHWLAVMLATVGYAVLTFDYSAAARDNEQAALDEFAAAAAFLGADPGIDRNELIAGGAGLSGAIALLLAAREPAVKAVFSLDTAWGQDCAALSAPSIRSATAQLLVPVLLVGYAPPGATGELYELAGGPKRMALLQGGGSEPLCRDANLAVIMLEWIRALQDQQLLQLLWVPPELLVAE